MGYTPTNAKPSMIKKLLDESYSDVKILYIKKKKILFFNKYGCFIKCSFFFINFTYMRSYTSISNFI